MSRGDLQEMEQSKTAVNANAKLILEHVDNITPGQKRSMKILEVQPLKTTSPMMTRPAPEPKVKTVSDIVNKEAQAAEPMKGVAKEELRLRKKRSSKKVLTRVKLLMKSWKQVTTSKRT